MWYIRPSFDGKEGFYINSKALNYVKMKKKEIEFLKIERWAAPLNYVFIKYVVFTSMSIL